MKTAAQHPSFELDLNNLLTPTSVIAVFQYINTLTSGEVLKVTACNQKSVMAVMALCKNSGNTLLQRKNTHDGITLFIKKC